MQRHALLYNPPFGKNKSEFEKTNVIGREQSYRTTGGGKKKTAPKHRVEHSQIDRKTNLMAAKDWFGTKKYDMKYEKWHIE